MMRAFKYLMIANARCFLASAAAPAVIASISGLAISDSGEPNGSIEDSTTTAPRLVMTTPQIKTPPPTTPAPVSLEVMLLQELSNTALQSESSDSLAGTLTNEILKTFTSLNETHRFSRFGYGTFIDRGVEPYGNENSYCYKVRYPLTHDLMPLKRAVMASVSQPSGDAKNCQLTALAEACDLKLNRWTTASDRYIQGEKILRFVVIVTDSDYHQQGDFLEEGYSETGELTQGPRPAYEPLNPDETRRISRIELEAIAKRLDEFDYPSVPALSRIMHQSKVVPLFVIRDLHTVSNASAGADDSGQHSAFVLDADTAQLFARYQQLIQDLGRGHLVVARHDFTNLAQVIQQGLNYLIVLSHQLSCNSQGRCPCDFAGECSTSDDQDVLIELGQLPKSLRLTKRDDSGIAIEAEYDAATGKENLVAIDAEENVSADSDLHVILEDAGSA